MNEFIKGMIVVACAIPLCWGMLKLLTATGIVETEEKTKRRKQREADEFENMTPEVQQLHIHAKNKVAEFKFSLVVFLITSIASGYLIYLCVK